MLQTRSSFLPSKKTISVLKKAIQTAKNGIRPSKDMIKMKIELKIRKLNEIKTKYIILSLV
ncbi:MAG: hypothetical protein CMO10_00330 [Thalassospira sp.]|nr:hypothetical protein [Thalassospira sp.]